MIPALIAALACVGLAAFLLRFGGEFVQALAMMVIVFAVGVAIVGLMIGVAHVAGRL